ncbi:M10 family metallopeptidase C-terminal domain-containing protein [Pseudomonas sp. L1(2025)]|uniref:M10 family metallopeptidase C-terminal domain-containing protein n=1 Tax=Pseudomonas sp. L1(2025) TaxID=3449429 RepID=UPI003F694443
MNVNPSVPMSPPIVTQVDNLPSPNTDPDTRPAADSYWNGVDNLATRSSRWIDKDGNGKIDIEVDFSAGPGSYFKKLGLTGHSELSAEQKQELIDQMIDISFETNLVFHDKGTLEKPDGTINFGNFAPVPSNGKNLVQVNFPENASAPHNPDKPEEPAEAYVRGDARNLKANGRNRGGHALAHALLHALGLPHPNPDDKSNKPANPTDSQGYSLLSSVPETATGHDYHGNYVTRAQMHDMSALTLRYGSNTENRRKFQEVFYDANSITQSDSPVTMTIASGDGDETLLADKDTHDQYINLNHGTFSSIGGFTNNVAITRGTHIEDVAAGSGTNKIVASTVKNLIVVGSGQNTVIFNNPWDSTPRDTDIIHGFKSGTDKVDISGFSQKLYNGTFTVGTPHLDIQRTPDGQSFVRYWSVYNPAQPSAPDFKVRADGIQMSDIITK